MSVTAWFVPKLPLISVHSHHIIQPSIFAQEDDLIEITHADTEDSGFRVSLNKMLGQSEEYDENGW